MKKMQSIYNLKLFFIESKSLNDEKIVLIDDMIYVDNIEHVETTIKNTHNAFIYINEHYDYDIIVRTNLSTFWNIPYFYEMIEPLGNQDIATGMYYGFLAGYSLIFSKDVCIKLCNILEYNFEKYIEEDVLISKYLEQFINLQSFALDKMYFLTNGEQNIIPDDVSKIMFFRIKSDGDRYHDGETFRKLVKKIYDINY
jgi:hypothetical protein